MYTHQSSALCSQWMCRSGITRISRKPACSNPRTSRSESVSIVFAFGGAAGPMTACRSNRDTVSVANGWCVARV